MLITVYTYHTARNADTGVGEGLPVDSLTPDNVMQLRFTWGVTAGPGDIGITTS